ncbi:DNA-binding response regulator [Sphingobacteriaceae bacterium]|nr:DNA-binding response regulator [Sphingobacteriaceae bacterium]
MPVRVFLVEGREIVRQGIKAMLSGEQNIILTGEANNEVEAYEKLALLQTEVVLLDMNIPVEAIVAFTKKVKEKHPEIRILILTMHDYESSLTRILMGGADGYVLKDTSKDELVAAIEKVNTEGTYMNPGVIIDLVTKHKSQELQPANLPVLTERESQVLDLIALGLTNVQMAKKLFTSVRTIETRRKNLLQKTGSVNTATLIRYAVLNGLIK